MKTMPGNSKTPPSAPPANAERPAKTEFCADTGAIARVLGHFHRVLDPPARADPKPTCIPQESPPAASYLRRRTPSRYSQRQIAAANDSIRLRRHLIVRCPLIPR